MVGASLTANPGSWSGTPAFSYRWLRCPATATSHTQCTPIPGAIATSYTPVKADLGMRVVVEVTAAANPTAVSKTTTFSAPSGLIAEAKTSSGSGTSGSGNNPNPPQTSLKKHPRKKTSKPLAKFAFVSDQAGAHFECKLDKKAFRPCRSPFKAKKLKRGRHAFRVRAVNGAGQVDPTPAVFRWKIS
jgi:hypothetical protein